VLFADVGPALVGQAYRHAILGMNSVKQVAVSTPKIASAAKPNGPA
jgi:hypothetical protein